MGTSLREIQLTQLEIAREISNICKRHSISFFLAGGSLLGAIRHKGFIPWDDDLDLMLLRDEYEKLLKVLNEELPSDYWLQTYETDDQYWLAYAKVRKRGTLYKEKGQEHISDEKCGIWVDIFPYETGDTANLPLLKIRKAVYETISFSLKRKILKFSLKSFSRRFIPAILFLSIFPRNILISIQKKIMIHSPGNKYAFGFASTYPIEKEIMPYDWLKNSEDVLFENYLFPVPCEWDKFLTQLYGNYMTPPPEGKRKNHSIISQ